jgi:hypothetical protein
MRLKKEVYEIVVRLQQLRTLGNTDNQIETIIKSLDLDFGLHMYIMGHYSELMNMKFA